MNTSTAPSPAKDDAAIAVPPVAAPVADKKDEAQKITPAVNDKK